MPGFKPLLPGGPACRYGIKRIEGRGWPTEHRGRLWIHATSKQPSAEEVQVRHACCSQWWYYS